MKQPATASGNAIGALPHFFVACVQMALLYLLYAQTSTFDYVYYDDAKYVLENPAVLSGLSLSGVRWAFTSLYMSNWHPLTWLSHMLDVSLFGTDAGWAHVHNVLLHGVNSLLVYILLFRYSASWVKAGVLSLIFLVHPLHVESVAWIAERKDLLCAAFYLLGLILYDDYRRHLGKLRYFGVLLAFVLALLAKPMAVTFPVVLLILDFFIYRDHFQVSRGSVESGHFNYVGAVAGKLPLILLTALSCMVTIFAQDSGNSLAYLESLSFQSRWTIATSAYLIYLKQALAPVNLVAFYALPDPSTLTAMLVATTILGALLALVFTFASRYSLMAAGACWYLVTLLPVIGLVQVGSQAHADRYMYLPSVGLLLACTYLLPSRGQKHFQLASLLTGIFLLYFSAICYWQVGYWKNQNILFSRLLEVAGPTYLAHLHLAEDFKQRGFLKEAREQATSALSLRPDLADSYQAVGNVALAEKQFQEAEKYFRLALAKGPKFPELLNNLGITLAEQGDLNGAIKAFQAALEAQPDMAQAQENLQHYTARLPQNSAP